MSDDLYDSPNFKKIIKLKLNTTSKGELLEALNKLENNPYVFYAEPNYYDQIEDDGSRSIHIPKRVGTEIVSSLSESKVNSYALEMINAYDAWNIASGEGVLVGVVDSGIDSSHIDLWGQTSYTYSESFVNNDSDPLSDAETLKLRKDSVQGDFIVELGKKPTSYDDIDGQYMGLFKFSHNFLQKVLDFYDNLDRNAYYDGKDFNNMYMTSFLQGIIDTYHNAKAVMVNGGWCEIDCKSDLEIAIIES